MGQMTETDSIRPRAALHFWIPSRGANPLLTSGEWVEIGTVGKQLTLFRDLR